MPIIAIRQAGREDAPAIAHIINESWRAAYAGVVPQATLDALSDAEKQRHLETGLDRFPEMAYYMLDVNGTSAGAASLHPTRDADFPGVGEFSFFYLLPAYWRSGYGTRLLAHVEREANARGFARLCCWTLAENARAIAFYEQNGYRPDGARQTVTIGIPLEVVRFVKTL